MATHAVRTRQQTRQDLIPTAANLKRSAIDSPEKQPTRKRSALGDVTNAIGKVVIDSSKKQIHHTKIPVQRPTRTRRSSDGTTKLTAVVEELPVTSLRSQLSNESITVEQPSFLLCSESSADDIGLKRPSSSSSDSSIECRRRQSGPTVRPSIKSNKPLNVQVVQQTEECTYDFDMENITDPFHVPHYARDIFEYYKKRESKFRMDDYMERQTSINTVMRSVLVDWMVEIQENFELNHETLYQAVKITDLYLTKHTVLKEKLQLIGATALFISCKFDERQPPCLDDFLYICDDAYTREELIDCEKKVLQTLDFDIGMPISYRFLRRFAKVSKVTMDVLTLARYILETALLFYEFVSTSDSLIAAAAFLLALRMKNAGAWTPVQVKYSGFKEEELECLMWKLNEMLVKAQVAQDTQTVRNKYGHEVFYHVANIPPLEPTKSIVSLQ